VYRLLSVLPLCLLLSPDQRVITASAKPLARVSELQEPLPASDEISFLEKCVRRYESDRIQGYSALMIKQERIGQKLQPTEEIEIFHREKPRSTFMRWLKGQRRAAAVLYVDGENKGMMLVHPSGLAGRLAPVVALDPEGPEAKDAGRYSVKQVGLQEGLARTLRDWKLAKEKGTLRVKYLGVRTVVEAGNRDCYTLQRKCEPGENQEILEVTVYIDKETWRQIRTVLKGEDNKLLGDYVYRDIRINPEFKSNQFQRSAVAE
jgi:hypothetical protein